MKRTCQDERLLNTINYYQLTQSLKKGGAFSSAIALIRNPNWFQKLIGWKKSLETDISGMFDTIIEYLDNQQVLMMLIPGHAILICDYEREADNTYKFKIYDENSVNTEQSVGEFSYMYVNSDKTEFSYGEITQKTYNQIVVVDPKEIEKYHSLFAADMLEQTYTTLMFSSDTKFKLTSENGAILSNDGENLFGDITIYDFQMASQDSSNVEYILQIDADTEYYFTELQGTAKITIYNENGYISLGRNNITSAKIKIGERLDIEGDDYQFQSYISTLQEVAEDEDGLISLSGETNGKTTIFTKEKSVSVMSESDLSNVTAKSLVGNETYKIPIPSEVSENTDVEIKAITTRNEESTEIKEPAKSDNATQMLDVKVSKIALSGISKKIIAGKKVKLTAKIFPFNATNKAVTWKSSNKKVAIVNSKGVVAMKKNSGGKKVTITAIANDGSGVKGAYTIKSMKGSVKKIALSGNKSVKSGKSMKLKAKITSSKGANTKLKWTSNHTKYAKVSSKGVVKAYKKGKGKTVKITAMAMDGSGKKAAIKIKIK